MSDYKIGDEVSIKARVVDLRSYHNSKVVTLSRKDLRGDPVRFDMHIDQIDRKLSPGEPDRIAILKGRLGDIWTFQTNRHDTKGWVRPTEPNTHWEWNKRFYEEFGPFSVFLPGDEI